jgi:hypothetical protein
MMADILRVAAFISGAGLLFSSVFLRETEEGQIESLVSELNKRTESRRVESAAAWTRVAVFASAQTASLLDALVGRRSYSGRLLMVTGCASITSVNIANLLFDPRYDLVQSSTTLVLAALGIIAIARSHPRFGGSTRLVRLTIAIVLLAALSKWIVVDATTYFRDHLPSWLALPLLLFFIAATDRFAATGINAFEWLPVVIVTAIACDVLIVAAIRWLLRVVNRARHPASMILSLALLPLVPAVFVALPMWLEPERIGELADTWLAQLRIGLLLEFVWKSNLYSCAILIVFLILAVALSLHWTMWEAIQRPLYALQRFGVFRHRKLMAGAGVFLLGLGYRPIGDFLKGLIGSS